MGEASKPSEFAAPQLNCTVQARDQEADEANVRGGDTFSFGGSSCLAVRLAVSLRAVHPNTFKGHRPCRATTRRSCSFSPDKVPNTSGWAAT